MAEYVKLTKSGDSLVIALPRAIRDALKLAWRDQLRLDVVGEDLIVTRVAPDAETRRTASRRAER